MGETEKIENDENASFAKFFEMDFFFEKVQLMKFEVYDVDRNGKSRQLSLIGAAKFPLSKVMGSPQQTYIQDIVLPGHL